MKIMTEVCYSVRSVPPKFSPIFASKSNFPSKTFKSFFLFEPKYLFSQVFAHLELCESNQIAKERLEAIEDHLRSLLEAMGEEERERVAREAERGDPRTGRTAAEVNERVPALGRMPVVIDTNVRIPAITGWANGRLTGANGNTGKAIGTNGTTGKATGTNGTTGKAAGAITETTGKASGVTAGATGKAAGATAGATGKASGATVTSGANARDTKATQTTECAIGRATGAKGNISGATGTTGANGTTGIFGANGAGGTNGGASGTNGTNGTNGQANGNGTNNGRSNGGKKKKKGKAKKF